MALAPGRRLGPYEILAPLGAGGMGEVYRARDSRLARDVAIKILPEGLAASPDALARFEREARVIASLSHPHICVLHDVGRENGVDFLVMELLTGETLATRLAAGPMPLDAILAAAAQMADALDRAHRAGIVHRDLKPGNVMVTRSGVKLMDFGLAKWQGTPFGDAVAVTQATPVTGHGTILGTLHYMAPEQLEGKDADARTDIWAFGCVLYEMVTGRRAFGGESQATIIASILKGTSPPLTELAPLAPPTIDRIVRTCLAKDPEDRWQSAHDLRRALELVTEPRTSKGSEAITPFLTRLHRSRWLPWTIAALSATIAVLFAWRANNATTGEPEPIELDVSGVWSSPGGSTAGLQTVALSPDGRSLAFVMPFDGRAPLIAVRTLADSSPRIIEGTEEGSYPFWSPDGNAIGYFAKNHLWTVAVPGGRPVALSPVDYGIGGTWNRSGVILFTRTFVHGIERIDAFGGKPTPVTTLDRRRGESAHVWPQFLPDQRHFLFISRTRASQTNRIEAGDLETGRRTVITEADSLVGYSAPWLLFVRDGNLFAQRFDIDRLVVSGDRRRILQGVSYQETWAGSGASVAGDRVAFVPSKSERVTLSWVELSGRIEDARFDEMGLNDLRLSPDARRLLYSKDDPQQGGDDLWVADLIQGVRTCVARTAADEQVGPWLPNGAEVITATDEIGPYVLQRQPVGGITPATPLATDVAGDWWPMDTSPDGRLLLTEHTTGPEGARLWLVSLDGLTSPKKLLDSGSKERSARFSPDGHWVAFVSDRAGRDDVYVLRVGSGAATQISSIGGTEPRWAPDGHTIYYRETRSRLLAVPIHETANALVPRAAHQIGAFNDIVAWDVARDGRLLVASRVSSGQAGSIRLRIGWSQALQ